MMLASFMPVTHSRDGTKQHVAVANDTKKHQAQDLQSTIMGTEHPFLAERDISCLPGDPSSSKALPQAIYATGTVASPGVVRYPLLE